MRELAESMRDFEEFAELAELALDVRRVTIEIDTIDPDGFERRRSLTLTNGPEIARALRSRWVRRALRERGTKRELEP